MAPLGVVEVYHIESGGFRVLLPVFQKVIIDNCAEVGKLEIVAINRESFLYLLTQ